MNAVSRRRVVATAGGAALAVPAQGILAACSGPTASQQPAKPAAGQQELIFMDWENIEALPTNTAVQNFQAKFPNIKVTVDPTPSDYETKMRALVAAGTPDDVHRINDDYVRAYAVNNLLTDLMPYIKRDKIKREDFFEQIYDFPILNGKYYAWSSGNSPRLLYLNRTLFQNSGVQPPLTDKYDMPGWTWDDFIATAQKVTKDPGGARPTFGVDMWDTGIEQTLLVASGVEEGIYSKDGKQFLMASPKGIEAMQALADLDCRYKVSRPNSFADSASTLFRQGRLGMLFATMGSTTGFRRDIQDFDWDVAPFPKRVTRQYEGSLVVYCIPKDAKNPDAGWQFLDYFTSDEGGKVFAENLFYIPVRKSAANQYVKLPAGQKPEHLKLFVDAMPYNRAINFTNNTERARQIYRPELTKAFRCEVSAKSALENVKKQVEDALVGAF